MVSVMVYLIKRSCACLAQLPCTRDTEQDRLRRVVDRHVKIVTSKMSCAQVRESVVRVSLPGTHVGTGEMF